ncbi:MAG: LPS-assembly protein LptD [Deltaproteobacteria bacterium]|nr:LPS-assembly protein LptD [Deltaproteobacteria bacterium]
MAENRSQESSIAAAFLGIGLLAIAIAGVCSLVVEGAAVAAPRASKKARGASGASGDAEGTAKGTRLMLSGKSLHLSCTRSLRDLAKNRLECFGNVYIRRPNELLTADYAQMDLSTEQLHAEGNVVYFTPDTVIYGTKMDFNFVTETGIITDGRVESDKYQLVGEKIERKALNHFIAYDGEYSTCRDCPASWKLMGHSIDLTVDGYAYLNQVFIKVNDAPTLYLPYAIIPVKTKRQSGLLFPRVQLASENGFTFIQPYFWAISRSMDATLAAGFYSLKGVKAEAEYRYMLGKRSYGNLNTFYLRDKQFVRDPYFDRYALAYNHNLELPWGFEQKMNILTASDRDYNRKIGDIPGRGEPGMISDLGLSRAGRDLSVWSSIKWTRNQMTPELLDFDRNTVQLLPSVSLATVDHTIVKDFPLYWGMTYNYSRFWRDSGPFDAIYPTDFSPPSKNFYLEGSTPLRRAQRFNLVPELYYLANFNSVLELVPSVQYRTFGYVFDQNAAAPTARGYLLAQAEAATSIERVYGGVIKHKLRPSLTYSNIPIVQQNAKHPFIKQLSTAGNEFDEFDIVPISSDTQLYFVPLGNSLSYQIGNKFILKEDGNNYRKVVDIVSGQSVNFYEYKKDAVRQPLSRFFTLANVETKRFAARGEYYYYPYIHGSTYNLGASYILARYTRRLLAFDRSIGFNYSYNQITTNSNSISGTLSWSINDYFGFLAGIAYSFPTTQNKNESPGVVQSVNGGLTYQSPSQCYKLTLLASRTIDQPKIAVTFNIPVNLSGEGFTNLQEGGGLVPQSPGQNQNAMPH